MRESKGRECAPPAGSKQKLKHCPARRVLYLEPMQIWAGLGNPGPKYTMNRHNVGFMATDVIANMHGFGPV